jgi:hypothetical protein
MLRRGGKVFVSCGDGLSRHVWDLLEALGAIGLDPRVYGGVSRPVGNVVTKVYIEARNDLLESDALVLLLGVTAEVVSDDWALDWVDWFRERGRNVLVYLLPVSSVKERFDAGTLAQRVRVSRSVLTFEALVPQLLEDLESLLPPEDVSPQ